MMKSWVKLGLVGIAALGLAFIVGRVAAHYMGMLFHNQDVVEGDFSPLLAQHKGCALMIALEGCEACEHMSADLAERKIGVTRVVFQHVSRQEQGELAKLIHGTFPATVTPKAILIGYSPEAVTAAGKACANSTTVAMAPAAGAGASCSLTAEGKRCTPN